MALEKLLRPLIVALTLCLSSFSPSQEKSAGPGSASASRASGAAPRGPINKYFAAYAREDRGAPAGPSGEASQEPSQNSPALSQTPDDRRQAIEKLDNLGLAYLTQKDYPRALESYRKALALAESLKDRATVANVLEAIASIYYEQGSYRQALESFDQSLKLRAASGDKSLVAATLNNIGNVHYQQENYAAAIDYYQKAIAGYEAAGDSLAIAGAVNNIGSAHYSQGNHDTALEHYEKGLKMAERLLDKDGQATSLLGIGLVYYAQGNYGPALEHFRKNLAIVEAMGDKNRAASTMHNIGLVYYRQQNYDSALDSYLKSLKLYEESGDGSQTATMLSLIGGVYSAQENYALALESYQKARARFEAIKHPDGVARMLANLAGAYYARGDHALALESYQKSLAQYEALSNGERVAETLERMGSVYYAQGDYDRSLDFAERASSLAKQHEHLDTLWRARLMAGMAYRALGQVQRAQQGFEQSVAAIETMRNNLVGGEQARQRFYKDKRYPYVALMELLLAQNKTAEAFAYAERVKVNTLSDVIESGGVRITKAMSVAEQKQERRLENAVVSLKAQMGSEKQRKQPDQGRLTSLGEQLQKARADHRAFETRLYRARPELKALRGESQPLKLEEAGGLLARTDGALLEYVVTEGRVYLFVIAHESGPNVEGQGPAGGGDRTAAPARRSGTRAVPGAAAGPRSLNPVLMAYVLNLSGKDLADRAAKFREMIGRRDESFAQVARELFDLLLKPASEQLRDKSSWTIVPDSVLWQVPFQALQPADARYLVESHAISYAPSLTALREMRKPRAGRAAPSKLLAFANPVISKQRVERIKLADAEANLDPAPETENEVKSLGRLYGAAAKIYAGAQAGEEKAKREAGDFKTLHFAAPASINDLSPMYSHVALADPDGDGREDGLLEAWEIMRLGLRAELAVLSAGETLEGRAGSGDGLMGLAWSFFVAGCPTTIISGWKSGPVSNAELMLELHRNLQSSTAAQMDARAGRLPRRAPSNQQPANQHPATSKAQALRQATLKLLQNSQYAHPFYWAGFAVVGGGR